MAAAPVLIDRLPLELAAALSAPLPPEAIQPHPTKDYLSSVKAIYVIERLNEVFGVGGWTYKTRVVENDAANPMVVMLVLFRVPAYGIRLEQYGGSDNKDRGDAYKGAVTDALSKIGSYLGIAIDVYKGGGPTKRNPRGMAVAQPKHTPAQQRVVESKLAAVKKPMQPAAAIAETIPAPEDEDRTRYTYTPAEDEPTELEIQLAESIAQSEERKALAARRQVMLDAFRQMEARYAAVGFLPAFGAILGRYCVQTPAGFPDSEEGMTDGLSAFQEMRTDVFKRETKHAAKWGKR